MQGINQARGPEPGGRHFLEVGRNQCGQRSAREVLWGSDGEDRGATEISLSCDLVQLSPGWDWGCHVGGQCLQKASSRS